MVEEEFIRAEHSITLIIFSEFWEISFLFWDVHGVIVQTKSAFRTSIFKFTKIIK